jgi:hypothetical protein
VKGAETNIEYMKGHLSRAKIGFQLSFWNYFSRHSDWLIKYFMGLHVKEKSRTL